MSDDLMHIGWGEGMCGADTIAGPGNSTLFPGEANCEECLRLHEQELEEKRKRKLNTNEDIDRVCRFYYLTDCNQTTIARAEKVSLGVVLRVINEYGGRWCERNKKELEEYRSKR